MLYSIYFSKFIASNKIWHIVGMRWWTKMRLLDFYIIWRGDMLFATVVPIAYFLLYLKNKQVTFVFLKFVMAFVICLYWATYACTFFYSYYDVIGWFKILIIPVFSIYSGFVLHLLKSKKKKVFFLISIVYIIFWCILIFWHCMSSM